MVAGRPRSAHRLFPSRTPAAVVLRSPGSIWNGTPHRLWPDGIARQRLIGRSSGCAPSLDARAAAKAEPPMSRPSALGTFLTVVIEWATAPCPKRTSAQAYQASESCRSTSKLSGRRSRPLERRVGHHPASELLHQRGRAAQRKTDIGFGDGLDLSIWQLDLKDGHFLAASQGPFLVGDRTAQSLDLGSKSSKQRVVVFGAKPTTSTLCARSNQHSRPLRVDRHPRPIWHIVLPRLDRWR